MSTLTHTAQAGGGGERLACRDAGAAACPPRVGPWGNISRTVAPRGAERCRGFLSWEVMAAAMTFLF